MYLVWLPFTMLNAALSRIEQIPAAVSVVIAVSGFFAGLGPYALADHLLARWRARDRRGAA